jgi:hypothetical protein
MTIPKTVARFNAHVTNRVSRPFAGWLPGFAVVTHVGRRSGRTSQTPVNMFRDGRRDVRFAAREPPFACASHASSRIRTAASSPDPFALR